MVHVCKGLYISLKLQGLSLLTSWAMQFSHMSESQKNSRSGVFPCHVQSLSWDRRTQAMPWELWSWSIWWRWSLGGKEEEYFNLGFFSVPCGLFLGVTVIVYVEDSGSWGAAYLILAIIMAFSIVTFYRGRP